jgi:hypothetical protein
MARKDCCVNLAELGLATHSCCGPIGCAVDVWTRDRQKTNSYLLSLATHNAVQCVIRMLGLSQAEVV